jgi:hypothetical protein
MERDARGLLVRQVSYSDVYQKKPLKEIRLSWDEKGDMQSIEFYIEKTGQHELLTSDKLDTVYFGPYGEYANLDLAH